MFCILDNQVKIAPEGVPYSHAQWFVNEGWMQSEEKIACMDKTVRGIVDAKVDVYFYVGCNFDVSDEVEKFFFLHLKDLQKLLNIKDSAHVYGGLIKQSQPGLWPPQKDYGMLSNFVSGQNL